MTPKHFFAVALLCGLVGSARAEPSGVVGGRLLLRAGNSAEFFAPHELVVQPGAGGGGVRGDSDEVAFDVTLGAGVNVWFFDVLAITTRCTCRSKETSSSRSREATRGCTSGASS